MKTLIILAISLSVFILPADASRKKTPRKKQEVKKPTVPASKKKNGEFMGRIKKHKENFKIFILETKDKKVWAINPATADKIKKYYGRTVKVKGVYYTQGALNVIDSISSVQR